jgi:hypothetical protein
MEVLIFIFVLAAIFTPIVFIGRWILAPIDRAAKSRKAPVRFSIGDFLCLFLAIQLPLAAVCGLPDEERRGPFWTFTIIAWIVAPTIWWACARALSKAGVLNGRHRFIFLGLVMPAVYYGLIPFIVLSELGAIAILLDDEFQFDRTALWLTLVWLALASVYVLGGLFTRRMLQQAHGMAGVEIVAGEAVSNVQSALPPTPTG